MDNEDFSIEVKIDGNMFLFQVFVSYITDISEAKLDYPILPVESIYNILDFITNFMPDCTLKHICFTSCNKCKCINYFL